MVPGLATIMNRLTAPAGKQQSARRPAPRLAVLLVMVCWFAGMAGATAVEPVALLPGKHFRQLEAGGLKRSYWLYVPKGFHADQPVPVVLALHGAAMNGPLMESFCGMDATADAGGFIVVYPNGTGTGPFLVWNAGGLPARMAANRPDDVAFINALLDDLATVVKVDKRRVYACGMSNGAMMCYRLAAELSQRIAAIAPVAGTIAIAENKPVRPVPVLHFHGTQDRFVPYEPVKALRGMHLMGVAESIRTWVRLDGCNPAPKTEVLTKDGAALKVTRETHGGGTRGAEVVLVRIDGGGHTWPGKVPMVGFIGKSTTDISANALIWEFFRKHPM